MPNTKTRPEPPILDARPTASGLEVWCKHCNKWHQHGKGDGHRTAHCPPGSPYYETGYVLRTP